MYIAMNRFKIVLGKENDFENNTNGALISLLHYDYILLTN